MRPGSLLAAAVLALLSAAPARAQLLDPEARPTRGPYIANAARAGDADPTAVQLNPAQLGLLPAAGLTLAIDAWGKWAPLAGRGFGLYWATPLFENDGFGMALSHVAGSPGVFPDLAARTVLTVSDGLRLGEHVALGASWSYVWGGDLFDHNTFDVGLSVRPGRRLAFGFVLEDIGEPTGAVSVARLYGGELVGRPLGTDRLELALAADYFEGTSWRYLVPRARLSVTVARGLRLFATGESSASAGHYALSSDADYRAELGFALDLEHVGLTSSARVGFPGVGDAGGGAAMLLRVSDERRPPIAATAFVARVDLEHVKSDAAFVELVRRLRALGVDPGVAAVLLHVDGLPLGLGRVEELRDLVAGLRARGKRVYAYGSFPETRDYYLATACDAIVLHPAGQLTLTGFSQTVTFYKHAMDALGVNVDLVRIAEYKGAMEPFVFEEQSAPVRANKNDLLDDVFRRFVTTVSRSRTAGGRALDEGRVRMLVDRGLFTPYEAQLVGLVDAVKDEDELEAWLRGALGRPTLAFRPPDPSAAHEAWPSRHVAVVLVDGTIVDGKSRRFPFGEDLSGGETLVEALEECRRDGSVGAVVLRVNSPGGSAFASDIVARAVTKLRRAGKPVIVSMGDIAASGGYYVSAPADAIFAEPSTLSGSIGIFGYKVDVRKLMATLGIGIETYRRGQHADYNSPFRPWTDEEIKIAAEKIRYFYELFINTVAEGRRARGLTRARVDAIGRGHVWTGAEAQGLGLVDQMGGVGAAIDLAARLGHVPLESSGLPALSLLPRPTGGLLARLTGLDAQASSDLDQLLGARLGPALRLLAPFLQGDGTGVEARVPYDLEVR
ncbi:MAG TPA: signal peptide peptidase SppA [Polyangia bacterium]|nr:signal peptide peptidase SppA [Polyangia bacterium]